MCTDTETLQLTLDAERLINKRGLYVFVGKNGMR